MSTWPPQTDRWRQWCRLSDARLVVRFLWSLSLLLPASVVAQRYRAVDVLTAEEMRELLRCADQAGLGFPSEVRTYCRMLHHGCRFELWSSERVEGRQVVRESLWIIFEQPPLDPRPGRFRAEGLVERSVLRYLCHVDGNVYSLRLEDESKVGLAERVMRLLLSGKFVLAPEAIGTRTAETLSQVDFSRPKQLWRYWRNPELHRMHFEGAKGRGSGVTLLFALSDDQVVVHEIWWPNFDIQLM